MVICLLDKNAKGAGSLRRLFCLYSNFSVSLESTTYALLNTEQHVQVYSNHGLM